MIICIILSSLALAAAVGCTATTVLDRKRSREQNAARFKEQDAQWKKRLSDLGNRQAERITLQNQAWEKAMRGVQERLSDLEKGAVPDYEKAKTAAKAVDDFHEGLANILNYDPYEAARLARDSGGEAL